VRVITSGRSIFHQPRTFSDDIGADMRCVRESEGEWVAPGGLQNCRVQISSTMMSGRRSYRVWQIYASRSLIYYFLLIWHSHSPASNKCERQPPVINIFSSDLQRPIAVIKFASTLPTQIKMDTIHFKWACVLQLIYYSKRKSVDRRPKFRMYILLLVCHYFRMVLKIIQIDPDAKITFLNDFSDCIRLGSKI
jgi:hypothetical protein